jgi:hypothetical protein
VLALPCDMNPAAVPPLCLQSVACDVRRQQVREPARIVTSSVQAAFMSRGPGDVTSCRGSGCVGCWRGARSREES